MLLTILLIEILFKSIVVGVTKMGNILPRAGIKPTYLAFGASVLPLHHVGSLMSPQYSRPPVYVTLCHRGQSVQTTTLLYDRVSATHADCR